ncbi:MAG: hypothetical protein K5765_05370 [Clostridia bacterium]|nr:hypothetical protein [Clostridia bacterium]
MGFIGIVKDRLKADKKVTLTEDYKNDYIAYDAMPFAYVHDVPLTIKSKNITTDYYSPKNIWEYFDYDVSNIKEKLIESSEQKSRYTITFPVSDYFYGIKKEKSVEHHFNGAVTIDIDIIFPEHKTNKSLIILNSFYKQTADKILEKFLDNGYTIIIPDFNALKNNTRTSFPEELEFCYLSAIQKNTTSLIEKDIILNEKKKNKKYLKLTDKEKHQPYVLPVDHLTKIMFNVKNNTIYWYTYFIRKTLHFLTKGLKIIEKPAIVAFKESGDSALQVAGLDKDLISAVGLINYSIYPELYDVQKYRTQNFEPISEETLRWIQSLSGVSYIKNLSIPLIFADPINDPKCNPDRLIDLTKIVKSPVDIFLSNNRDDNIAVQSFEEFLIRLDSAFYGSLFPAHPLTTINENNLPRISVTIKVDNSIPVDSVYISYGYFEYEHSIRVWHTLSCEKVNDTEYIIHFDLPAADDRHDLYYYAQVKYLNGIRVTEFPKYYEIRQYTNKQEPTNLNYPLFECSQPESEFKTYMFDNISDLSKKYDILTENKMGILVENYNDAIALSNNVKLFKPKDGPYGIICENNSMVLFIGNKCENKVSTSVMKVTSYSDLKTYPLEIHLVLNNPEETMYSASKIVKSNGRNYTSTIFECRDFRDKHSDYLKDWKTVKKVIIASHNVAIYEIVIL